MSDASKGIIAMIAASVIWGLSPLYYKVLAQIPPMEVLAHRTIWSFVIFGLVLAAQGRLAELRQALAIGRNRMIIAIAGLLISLNWFTFILSVQIGRAVEASLGYYIFPLVAVALGFLVFRERLRPVQVLAVVLAATGVIVLSVGQGTPPWIALILASSFGTYGLLKRMLPVGPVVSVTGEVFLLLPLALLWLWGVHFAGWTGFTGRAGGYFGENTRDSLLLMFSGAITAGPLMLFSYATKRLSMASVGLIQYVNPSLQFLMATLVLNEVFTIWHALCFGLIWMALAIYTITGLGGGKLSTKASSSA